MRAAIVVTGTGPILVLTTFESLNDHELHVKIKAKGIGKFIMREVPIDQVKKRYGGRFNNLVDELHEKDLRVLDYNGNQVFVNFEFPELGEWVEVEDEVVLP